MLPSANEAGPLLTHKAFAVLISQEIIILMIDPFGGKTTSVHTLRTNYLLMNSENENSFNETQD